MVLKRSLENSGSESAKKQKLDSTEILLNNENKPELVINLTEEEEYIEPEKRLDILVNSCRNGKIEVVEQVLKLDFDVNSRDGSNIRPYTMQLQMVMTKLLKSFWKMELTLI